MTDLMSGVSLPAIELVPSVMGQQAVTNLTTDQTSIARLEEQLSTGNQVNQPSDNPAQASNIMQINAALTRADTYAQNASDGLGWLSTADSTMNEIISTLQQVRQTVLSISVASLTSTPGAMQALADQVNSAQQSLLNLSNTTYAGQAVFAGTGNVTTAFNPDGTYAGGGNAPTRTVAPGTSMAIAVTGDKVFGTGTTGLLSTVPGSLGVLAQISQDISTGSQASLANAAGPDLKNLDSAIATVEDQAAQLGAQYQQMSTMQQQVTSSQAALDGELSGIQSVNLPQAITNLQTQQSAYQTALWATSQLIQPSLVQFLG
ncbi:MAG TPA: flagellar hook-associated protein FlgL [Acidimicrobiales bacterium]|nr:flagellar hook-associated protein FlgL [Acidimicrobiales bacterium]